MVYRLLRNSFFEISASTLAIKLRFGGNEFGRKIVRKLETRIRFYKKSSEQAGESIGQLNLSPM